MAEPFKEIFAIIEQNKAKTEAVVELEKRLQNLQESNVKQYALMQEKDCEFAQLQLELQQNQERIELVAHFERQLQSVQEANKLQLTVIQQKDNELAKLEQKLDVLAAKRLDKSEENGVIEDGYWESLMDIQNKLQHLNHNVTELGDTVNHFDGKLEVEDYECPNYETMKNDHAEVSRLVRKKEKLLQDLKRKYEANVEKLTKDNEAKAASIQQVQQQVYDKSVQLGSAQTALSLSHERLALVKPEWMEKKQQFDPTYRN